MPHTEHSDHKPTDWIRQGECNQCGDCCRQATNLITVSVPIPDEAYGRVRYGEPVGRVQQLGGVPVFHIRGPVLLPCPKLDGDRCGIHETKPEYCRITPCAPEDIEGLPKCSYWFVHRDTGEIKGKPPQT
jgi:Fe-S-cluster containining protein